MVLPKPVMVPAEVLAWLVRTEGLGELHVVLAPQARWVPRAARDELAGRYRDEELARFGPVDRHGRLDVEVLASLAVLCRATTEFYGWIRIGETTKGVLAAAIGKEALLAIRDGNSVWLSQVRCGALAEALVAQTADVPAARASAVTVDRAEVLATRAGRQPTASGIHLRPASPTVRLVQQITALDITGCGELRVAVRDAVGRRRVAEYPLCYTDTVRGRFLSQLSGTGGEARMRVAPAGRADLVARLEEVHRSLVR